MNSITLSVYVSVDYHIKKFFIVDRRTISRSIEFHTRFSAHGSEYTSCYIFAPAELPRKWSGFCDALLAGSSPNLL